MTNLFPLKPIINTLSIPSEPKTRNQYQSFASHHGKDLSLELPARPSLSLKSVVLLGEAGECCTL